MQPSEARSILGVSPGASISDIKAAYRKLAKQHHPDQNQDNPDAAAQFHKINEAYTTLTDNQTQRSHSSWHADNMTFWHEIVITVEEGFNGVEKEVNTHTGTAKLKIFPGTQPNSRIRIDDNNLAVVRIRDGNFHFSLNEFGFFTGDIRGTLSVPAFRLILGGKSQATLIDGKVVRLHIPQGATAGTLLKVKGHGYQRPNGTRGDCYFRIVPEIKKIQDIDPELVAEMSKAINETSS